MSVGATCRHIWKNSRLETAILAAVFPFALCLFLTLPAVVGCASTPAGIAREQKIYSAATDVVSTLENFVPGYWRTTSSPPAYPAPGFPRSWTDVYFYPPADRQQVWLRRWPGDIAAVPATYS